MPKNPPDRQKTFGYDETFKILAKHFFESFSKVITDFEIINLPKKADILVVETDKPIHNYTDIFSYFKRVNIIEFKSVDNPFNMTYDLHKLLIYLGGVCLNTNQPDYRNTTITVVSSRKPVRLLKAFAEDLHELKKGVYYIKGIVPIPVYFILANEVTGKLSRELAVIKEFTTGKERMRYLTSIINEVITGNTDFREFLYFAFCLYMDEMRGIMKKEGIKMTLAEINIEKWNKELGLRDRYIKEGKKEDAKRMLAKGYPIEDIIDITGLTKDEILKLQ